MTVRRHRPQRALPLLRRRRAAVAAVAVAVLAAACGGSVAGSPVHRTGAARPSASTTPARAPSTTGPGVRTAPSTTTPAVTSLAVVACPTTRGVPGNPPAAYPSSITVAVDPSVGDQLAYYSDSTRSLAPVMGPRGWDCGVEVGADGSTVLAVYPPAEAAAFGGNHLYPQPFTASTDQAVVAYTPSACQGCVDGLVCPLIPTAGTQLGYPQPCPRTPPAGERIAWLSGSAGVPVGPTSTDRISFEDPPGIAGDGTPSGGPDPANGVINYTHRGEGAASALTCTLPASRHALCTAILNDFDRTNWPTGGG